jgi:uncharacterized protein (TIGR04222 family)
MQRDLDALVAKIEACELDDKGAAEPLSRRLARENGWSERYALRVLREYRRFVLLAVTREHVVTPSAHVDQAWHLHLLHTARYRRFCSEVLGRVLDHHPSDGSAGDRARLALAYERTLASYAAQFGAPAPSDIWPRAQPKPRLWRWLRTTASKQRHALLVASALLALGCGDIGLAQSVSGPDFLRGFFWLWLAALAAAYLARRVERAGAGGAPPELEPYALAQLAGGSRVAVDSAVTSLLEQRALQFDGESGKLQVEGGLPEHAPPAERAVYEQVQSTGTLGVDQLHQLAPELTRPLSEQLLAQGLMTAGGSRLPLALALLAPLWGCVRMLSRVGTDKPIGLLLVWSAVATLIAFIAFRPRPQRTPLGDATLAAARLCHEPLRSGAPVTDLAMAGTLPIALGLFGFGAAAFPEESAWGKWLGRRAPSTDSSSTDAGGGCSGGDGCGGGGDCGGGCGGCGGGE